VSAVFRREVRTYFTSPIGYIFISLFYLFSGIFMYFYCVRYATADLTNVVLSLSQIVMYLAPLLTMRLFSEDRKNKTDQALFTAPVTTGQIVMGKFFAAMMVMVLGAAILIVYGLIFSLYAPIEWLVLLNGVLGLILHGAALIAIGSLISALTENQVIAAVGAFGVALLVTMLDSVATAMSSQFLRTVFTALSFYEKYYSFSQGLLNIASILFFVSVSGLFLYYTVRSIDRRRYAG